MPQEQQLKKGQQKNRDLWEDDSGDDASSGGRALDRFGDGSIDGKEGAVEDGIKEGGVQPSNPPGTGKERPNHICIAMCRELT
jgi:hypothetical protein